MVRNTGKPGVKDSLEHLYRHTRWTGIRFNNLAPFTSKVAFLAFFTNDGELVAKGGTRTYMFPFLHCSGMAVSSH